MTLSSARMSNTCEGSLSLHAHYCSASCPDISHALSVEPGLLCRHLKPLLLTITSGFGKQQELRL